MPAPTLGRIVHYKLSADDAEQVNRRREDARQFAGGLSATDMGPGNRGQSGHVRHFGTEVAEGDVFPATVTRIPGISEAPNLQVTLDGNDHLWVPSAHEGDEPGTWSWPPRA